MDDAPPSRSSSLAIILSGIEALPPSIEASSAGNSLDASVSVLRECGALHAPVPIRLGGLGMGVEVSGSSGLFCLLRAIGRRDLALGRVYEGHVNALQLVCRYGDERQREAVADDARAGHLFAIWDAELAPGVRLGADGRLQGSKSFGSAAGLATRAVITFDQAKGGRLALVRLEHGERVAVSTASTQGMRRARTGAMDFTAYRLDPAWIVGSRGDYLREPVFSAGAWRTMAVLLGGLELLFEETRRQLRALKREGAPAQRLRIADMAIAVETSRLWVRRCAKLADGAGYANSEAAHYVALARRTLETCAFRALEDAQRCLGLSAFRLDNPVEELMRDLTTYLRQPALDMAVDEAAEHYAHAPTSDSDPRP
jgi:alkylation response protein AidB-like acyl-CoA dehydrogenase